MVIGSGGRSLKAFVHAEFDFLTCLAHFFDDDVVYTHSVDCKLLEFVEATHAVSHGSVKQTLCKRYEACVLGNEVGFAVKSHDCGEVSIVLGEHATFGSFAVFALGGYCLTLLAENLDSGIDVAVSFGESFFAVHQAGTGEVAQLGDFCHCYCHNIIVFMGFVN